ncbi:hypothetical protein CRUP_017577 [Coryphaenoides rupestris]|nr:hypothetical protein CRUP_017577 [Coryphaenoides rupestris]
MWIAGALAAIARGHRPAMMEALSRARAFTTKPGVCPGTDAEVPGGKCDLCDWDIDCSGWQKCCKTLHGSQCVNPTPKFSRNEASGDWTLNVTVTVKIDYERVMDLVNGLLNHTRLLHAMVWGALNSSDVWVRYLGSRPVEPYRTATSLMLGSSNGTVSLDDAADGVHLLLRDIAEVSSVTVEDVDECAHPVLHNCSPQAECRNTAASYNCTCRHGYTRAYGERPGARLVARRRALDQYRRKDVPVMLEANSWVMEERSWRGGKVEEEEEEEEGWRSASGGPAAVDDGPGRRADRRGAARVGPGAGRWRWQGAIGRAEHLHHRTLLPPCHRHRHRTWTHAGRPPCGQLSRPRPSSTAAGPPMLSATYATTPSYSDPSAPTSAAPQTSPSSTSASTTTPPGESTTCAPPPPLTQLFASNITGTSFRLYWSSGPSPSDQTSYLVVLREAGSEVGRQEISGNTSLNVTRLDLGVLYSVTVTPCACGAQAESLRVSVKTAAQTVTATARVTNVNFTEDFLNSSSQAYLDFTATLQQEISQSLSPELRELVESGEVRIEITSVSRGSVVVQFNIVSGESYEGLNVSGGVLSSLLNSSVYAVDKNSSGVSASATTAASVHLATDTTTTVPTASTALATPTATEVTAVSRGGGSEGISVDCRLAGITVSVPRAFLLSHQLSEASLSLGPDADLVAELNGSHLQLANDTHYTAHVTLTGHTQPQGNGSTGIVRNLRVPITCALRKSALTSTHFDDVVYNMDIDPIAVSGTFRVIMQLLSGTSPLPHNYTLYPDEAVVVQVALNTSAAEDMKLVIRRCWATTTPSPAYGRSHVFLNSSSPEELSLFHVVGFSVLGIAISLVFICGLTCVFFYQRNRIGHYNFSIKPKEDNFTFHAFDK